MCYFKMEEVISLRPNSSKKPMHSICSEKMKHIYNLKFHTNKTHLDFETNSEIQDSVNDKKQFSRACDIILDCEYGKELFNMYQSEDYIPEDWKKYSLDDFISIPVFRPKETSFLKVSQIDIEEFYASIDSHLYYEEDIYVTEDEQE